MKACNLGHVLPYLIHSSILRQYGHYSASNLIAPKFLSVFPFFVGHTSPDRAEMVVNQSGTEVGVVILSLEIYEGIDIVLESYTCRSSD